MEKPTKEKEEQKDESTPVVRDEEIKGELRQCENSGIAEVLQEAMDSIDPLPPPSRATSAASIRSQDLGPGAYFTNANSGHMTPAGKTPLNVLGAELRMANKPGLTYHNNQSQQPPSAPVQPQSAEEPEGSITSATSDIATVQPSQQQQQQTSSPSTSDLMVANPVDEDESLRRHNLPKAEEYDPEAHTARTVEPKDADLKQPIYCAVGILVSCAIVLLLVFTLSKQDARPDSNADDAMVPTSAPTVFTLPNYILSLLPTETQNQIQQDPTSPQALAYEWILEDAFLNTKYTDSRAQQRFVLATLYYATTGDQWSTNANWLDYSVHECNWATMGSFAMKDTLKHVYPGFLKEFFTPIDAPPTTCNDHGLFQHLWLDQNNLVGSLPEELYMLTHLKTLSIGLNRLEGTLSTRIGQLTSLEGLAIFFMRNAGTIPTELGLLTNLRGIGLNDNGHTGTLPTELLANTNLSTFIMSRNPDLKFTIPTEIGLFKDLRWLSVDDCGIHGSLPSEIGQANLIDWMPLGGNQFTGTVPSEVGLLTRLGQTSFHENNFHGTIPTEVGLLSNLFLLSFRANNMTGTIPTEIGLLASMRLSLNFQDNPLLSGGIPSEVGLLTHLEELSFLNNNQTGPIPSELGKLTRLQRLNLANNSLTGTIPLELAEVSQSLYTLEFQGNGLLSGTVPPELCTINGTCAASVSALNNCENDVGLVFDCTGLLCGCSCSCGDNGDDSSKEATGTMLQLIPQN